MDKKLISIVIPCYDEEENISRTFDGLLKLIEGHEYDFEIIAVNDGSSDSTWEVIKSYAEKHEQIVGINQMRNYGQSAAYQAGFDVALGDYVLILSADLEIPLENISKVIHHLDEGFDLVNTHRIGRWGDEKGSRRVKSGMANKIISKVSKLDIKDRG